MPQNPQEGRLVGERTWLATKLKKDNPSLREIPDEDVERLYADKFPELKGLVGKPMSEAQQAEFRAKDINLPVESFGGKAKTQPPPPAKLPDVPTPEPRSGSFGSGYQLSGMSGLKDMGLSALRAGMAVGDIAVGGLDLISALGPQGPGAVSRELEALGYDPKMTKDFISSFDSEALKKAQKEYAEAEGLVGKIKSVWRNPGLAGLALTESVPLIAAGGAAGSAIKGATGAAPLIAGALGEGAVTAASQAAQIREEKGELTYRDAAIATGSGLATGGITLGGGRIAKKLGLPDIDEMLADKSIKGTRKIPALIGGGLAEGLIEEAPQSAQEQVAVNLATGKPLGTDVAGSTVMGSVTGFAMGAGIPGARGIKSKFSEVKVPNAAGTTHTYTPTGHPNVDAANAELAAKGLAPLTDSETQKIIAKAAVVNAAVTSPVVPPPTDPNAPALVNVGQVAIDRMNKFRAKGGLGPLSNKEAKIVARKAEEADVARKIQEKIATQQGEPSVPAPVDTSAATAPTATVPPPTVTRGTTFEPGLYQSHEGRQVIVEGPSSTFGKDAETGALVPIAQIAPVKVGELTPDHVRKLRGTPNVPIGNVPAPNAPSPSPVVEATRTPEQIFAAQPDVDPNLNQGVGNPANASSGVAPIPVAAAPAPVVTAPSPIVGAGPTQPTRTVPNPNSKKATAPPSRRITVQRGKHQAVDVIFSDEHGKRVMSAFKKDGDSKSRQELINQASFDFKIPTHGDGKSAAAGLQAYRRYILDGTKKFEARTDDPNGFVFEPKSFSQFMTQNYLPEEGAAARSAEAPGKDSGRRVNKFGEDVELQQLKGHYGNLLEEFGKSDTTKARKAQIAIEITDTLNKIRAIEPKGGPSDKHEGPALAKVKGGGLVVDADITRAATNITKDYTGALSGIIAREGLQNALDAADKLGTDGKVIIRLSKESGQNVIEIHDNGSGLDETGLSEKLVRLFASGKENEAGATGGKGIGSASYILGGKDFRIDTIAIDSDDGKKYRIRAGGTPAQFLDPKKGSDFEKTLVSKSTPTGTTIKVTLKLGETGQSIEDTKDMITNIVDFSRNRKSTVIYDKYNDTAGTPIEEVSQFAGGPDEFKFKDTKDDKVIGDFTTQAKTSAVTISIPTYDKTELRSTVYVQYLNNGMYQFFDSLYLGESIRDVPENVIVDIHPLVDEMHDDYPFINTREDIKKDIREEIKKFLEKNIKGPAVDKRKNRLQELYDEMKQDMARIPGLARDTVLFDPGNRLTPAERKAFVENPTTEKLFRFYDKLMADILGSVNKPAWADRLESVGIVLDPGMHGVHIPNPATGKSTIAFNPFIRMANQNPADSSFSGTITGLHEAAHIGTEKGDPIALNPDDLTDPRIGAYLESYINQLIRHGDVGWGSTGHGMDFAHRLGEVYAGFGARETFKAADELESIVTDKTGGYSSEIQELLHIYTESRGRDETTEDLLSGTGVKSKASKPSKGDSTGSNKADGDRTARGEGTKKRKKPKPLSKKRRAEARKTAIEKIHHILGNVEPIRLTMEEKRTLARSRRLRDFHRVRTKGMAGMYEAMSKLSGPLPKADFESIAHKFTDDEMTTLVDMVHESSLGGFSKPAAYSGLMKIFNTEFGEIPTATETIFLGDVFGKKLKETITKMRGDEGFIDVRGVPEAFRSLVNSEAFGKVTKWTDTRRMGKWYRTTKHPVLDVMDGLKAFILGMDSAAPGRQGLALIHKEAFWKALGPQYKAMWSEDYHQQNMKDIEKKVMFRMALDAGLELTTANPEDGVVPTDKGDVALNKTENDIAYGFAEAIPGLGRMTRGSNRGAVTFLDNLRIDTFTQLAMARYNHSQEATVETMKELEDIARFVNIMTGRGQSGKFIKMLSPVLNRMYFSVPWVVSRIQLLDPRNYYSKETSSKLLNYSKVYEDDSIPKALGKVASNIPRMIIPFKKTLEGKPPKFMVNEYRKALGSLLAQGGIVLTTVYGMYLIGSPMVPEFEIGVDPRKSDFGKAKIGHGIELDVFGGVMQYIVLGTRLARGEMVNKEGEVVPFDKHAGGQGPTRWSTLDNWQANKTLPYVEIIRMWLENLNRQTGKPPKEGEYQEKAIKGVTPISVQDFTEIYRANPWALPFIVYALLGGGVNVMDKKPQGSQFRLPGGGKEIDKFDIPGGKKY